MSHFASSKKQLKHITKHNKYTEKQDRIKKITYCCHEQNVQITIGNSDGAQKTTAVEHINQNSFLLIIFARTVIASSYDISSYNKIDVFSL